MAKIQRLGSYPVREANIQRLQQEFETIVSKDGEHVNDFAMRIIGLATSLRSLVDIQEAAARPLMDHRLLEAATNGNVVQVLELLNQAQSAGPAADHVAIITIPDQGVMSDGDGVLHIAARRQHFDIVNAVLPLCGPVDVAAKNNRGETALHCAAASGNGAVMSALLTRLAEDGDKRQLLRMQKDNGETCLHEAVRCGKVDAVEMLVQGDVSVVLGPNDGRALVRICDEQGVSPLFLATTLRQLDIVEFLTGRQLHDDIEYPAASYDGPGGKTALHAAVLLGKDLSEHLASWNDKELIGKADLFGNTPLHLLASTNDKIIVKLLLDLDTSSGYRADSEGSLPIHVAAANGCVAIVEFLSVHCPNSSWSCNNLGQTILHVAVQKRRIKVVNYVCSGQKFEGILNTRDHEGNTALHLAVLQGSQFIFLRLMRRRKVYLNFANEEAHTPLDVAQLNLPPGLLLSPSPREWIMYDLIIAGADYGTRRMDQFAPDVEQSVREKESESIGKSARLVAICAVLILTIAFSVPFTVTTAYNELEDTEGYTTLEQAIVYRIFMVADAIAFAFSAVATACCTFAGFSSTDRRTRLFYLAAGAVSLRLAAMSIIVVFMAGVYVAVSPVDFWVPFAVCPFGVLVLMPQLMPVFVMLLHAWVLLLRLGFPTWFRNVIYVLPRRRRDRIPIRYRRHCMKSLATVASILVVCAIISVCAYLPTLHLRK